MKEKLQNRISKDVHDLYWFQDRNCAFTTLNLLSGIFEIPLHSQVLDGATGMHGAGKFGAQCGLVEGTLLFLGILGKVQDLREDDIEKICYTYAGKFEDKFGSLLCRDLRPEGFSDLNPPHLCEDLTVKSITFSVKYILDTFAELDINIT